MSFDLTGKAALVTGASSGLGRHFATLLAAHGAKVAVAARRLDRLESLVAEIGSNAAAVELDVEDAPGVAAAIARAEDAVGPIDILVNNAGVADSQPFLEIDLASWDKTMAVNLRGVFLVAQAVARSMAAGDPPRGGAIVNVSSILADRVRPRLASYCASKAAVSQLTRAMTLDLARYGVRANALCPGYVETDLNHAFLKSDAGAAMRDNIPDRRFGEKGDLDGALLLLCSDAGRHINGQTIAVDGGHLVSSL